MQKEHRLSFCINLEVVILEVEIQLSFFGRIHDTIDCFRDLLTFSYILFFQNIKWVYPYIIRDRIEVGKGRLLLKTTVLQKET